MCYICFTFYLVVCPCLELTILIFLCSLLDTSGHHDLRHIASLLAGYLQDQVNSQFQFQSLSFVPFVFILLVFHLCHLCLFYRFCIVGYYCIVPITWFLFLCLSLNFFSKWLKLKKSWKKVGKKLKKSWKKVEKKFKNPKLVYFLKSVENWPFWKKVKLESGNPVSQPKKTFRLKHKDGNHVIGTMQ